MQLLTDDMNTSIKEILSPIDPYLKMVDDEIIESLKSDIPLINYGAMHLFKRGGKKVRASLVILTSALRGPVPDDTIKIAAAAEIVHAATLIHDDIIDKSFLRRGDITVSERWGNKIAVLVGDFMYISALDSVVRDVNPKLFPVLIAGTKYMVQGELYQLQHSNIDSITEEHYFNIIELKTARFMAACTKLGSLNSGAKDEVVERFYEFGLNLGMAFQIVDDTLDFADGEDNTGKDKGNDLADGKITLPLLYMLNRSTPADSKLIKDFSSNPDPGAWPAIRERLINSGSIEYCRGFAEKYIKTALDILDGCPEGEYKSILANIAKYFLFRKN